MTFSIIIPAYNGGKFIEKAILSSLSQTRKADEIIVHDDNSNDKTRLICEKFFPEVKTFYNPEGPSGFVTGWNKAIALASGDYISVLHQDDILYPTFLEEVENALTLHPDILHLFTLCDYIDENDSILECGEESVLKVKSTDKIIRYSGKEYVRAYQKKYCRMPHIHRCPGVITHRSIFAQGCNYNKAAGHIADDDFFYRVGQFTSIIGIMKSLAAYRIHKESETGRIGDVTLVNRLAIAYIYQMKQWQNSDFMGKNEMFYFENLSLKFVRRLFSYSINLKDQALKEKASKLYSEIQHLKFRSHHLFQITKLETVKLASSFIDLNFSIHKLFLNIYKNLNINLIKVILYFANTKNSFDLVKNKILVVAPHPDDEILGMGGYLLKMQGNGCKINIIYMTNGEGSDVWPNKEEIERQRIKISEKVNKNMGINNSDIIRLHLPDKSIPFPSQAGFEEAAKSLKEIIDFVKPDMVFVTHPIDYWPFDHVACAQIAKEAVKQSVTKPQLWYYWVWAWYNIIPWRLSYSSFKGLQKIDIRFQLNHKKELMNIYLNALTPDGKPWSGILPKPLLKAFNLPIEVVERVS